MRLSDQKAPSKKVGPCFTQVCSQGPTFKTSTTNKDTPRENSKECPCFFSFAKATERAGKPE